MKHFKQLFLAMLMALTSNVSANAEDFTVGGWYFNILSPTTCEITHPKWDWDTEEEWAAYRNFCKGEISIPSQVSYEGNVYNVIRIGESAFSECDKVTAVSIPATIINIGTLSFVSCTGLQSVTIPSTVVKIDDGAFGKCYSLESVNFEDGTRLNEIGEKAFAVCESLKEISIPNSVVRLGARAFYGCQNLEKVTLSENISHISLYTFSGCEKLKEMVIPDRVQYIGSGAFYSCSSLESLTIGDGVRAIGYSAFNDCNSLKSVKIKSLAAWCNIEFGYKSKAELDNMWEWVSEQEIREDENPLYYAHNLFLNDELVTNLVVPDGIKKIHDCAFINCTNLETLSIPSGLDTLGIMSFQGCKNLKKVQLGDGVKAVMKDAFRDCHLDVINIPASMEYLDLSPSTLTLSEIQIEDLASWCKVELPYPTLRDAEYISSYIYYDDYYEDYCYTFRFERGGWVHPKTYTLNIPEGVETIKTYTFSGLPRAYYIHIPNSVTEIQDEAFYKTCIDSLYLGTNVQHIGKRAFAQPNNFTETRAIVCYGEVPPVCDEEALDGISREECVLYVPEDFEMSYQSTAPWSEFKQIRRIELNKADAINDIVCQRLEFYHSEQGLTISGTEQGKRIELYTIGGMLISSVSANDNESTIPCNLQKGEVVIIKYGDKSIKYRL